MVFSCCFYHYETNVYGKSMNSVLNVLNLINSHNLANFGFNFTLNMNGMFHHLWLFLQPKVVQKVEEDDDDDDWDSDVCFISYGKVAVETHFNQ